MKPAFKIKLTKKQAKAMKKSCRSGKVYAVMNDGRFIELKQVFTKPTESDNAPFFINVKLEEK